MGLGQEGYSQQHCWGRKNGVLSREPSLHLIEVGLNTISTRMYDCHV
jgi:hypothetical protein